MNSLRRTYGGQQKKKTLVPSPLFTPRENGPLSCSLTSYSSGGENRTPGRKKNPATRTCFQAPGNVAASTSSTSEGETATGDQAKDAKQASPHTSSFFRDFARKREKKTKKSCSGQSSNVRFLNSEKNDREDEHCPRKQGSTTSHLTPREPNRAPSQPNAQFR